MSKRGCCHVMAWVLRGMLCKKILGKALEDPVIFIVWV